MIVCNQLFFYRGDPFRFGIRLLTGGPETAYYASMYPSLTTELLLIYSCVTGILAGMWPCGIILFVSELFISESLSQVYGILHEFLQRQKDVAHKLGNKSLLKYDCIYSIEIKFAMTGTTYASFVKIK